MSSALRSRIQTKWVTHDGRTSWQEERIPGAMGSMLERLRRIPEFGNTMHPVGPGHRGVNDRGLLAVLNPERLRRILTKMLDENEFMGPNGIRSISKFRERNPYVFYVQGQEYRVDYLPAKSNTGMYGGNSNWRGPVWMPVNAILRIFPRRERGGTGRQPSDRLDRARGKVHPFVWLFGCEAAPGRRQDGGVPESERITCA